MRTGETLRFKMSGSELLSARRDTHSKSAASAPTSLVQMDAFEFVFHQAGTLAQPSLKLTQRLALNLDEPGRDGDDCGRLARRPPTTRLSRSNVLLNSEILEARPPPL